VISINNHKSEISFATAQSTEGQDFAARVRYSIAAARR
jgi:hypothetical protein